jgi:hypothetical protein
VVVLVAKFDAVRSPLPDRPDEAKAEAWFQRVRAAYYVDPGAVVNPATP